MYNVSIDYLIRGKEYQNKDTPTNDTSKLEALICYFINVGYEDPYFLQLEKWEQLTKADLQEITSHFEWVVNKAKKRE